MVFDRVTDEILMRWFHSEEDDSRFIGNKAFRAYLDLANPVKDSAEFIKLKEQYGSEIDMIADEMTEAMVETGVDWEKLRDAILKKIAEQRKIFGVDRPQY